MKRTAITDRNAGYDGLTLGWANCRRAIWEFPFGRYQRGSRIPRPPDAVAFRRRYSA